MRIDIRRLLLVACGATLLAGCQGPPLPIASDGVTSPRRGTLRGTRTAPRGNDARAAGRSRFSGVGASTSPFERLTQRAAARETGSRSPRGVVVTDEMIARVERAVRLRQRAHEPIPPDRSMATRAANIPPPSKNGDGGGICIDPSRLLRFLEKVITD